LIIIRSESDPIVFDVKTDYGRTVAFVVSNDGYINAALFARFFRETIGNGINAIAHGFHHRNQSVSVRWPKRQPVHAANEVAFQIGHSRCRHPHWAVHLTAPLRLAASRQFAKSGATHRELRQLHDFGTLAN
jgi:hypothetical protein